MKWRIYQVGCFANISSCITFVMLFLYEDILHEFSTIDGSIYVYVSATAMIFKNVMGRNLCLINLGEKKSQQPVNAMFYLLFIMQLLLIFLLIYSLWGVRHGIVNTFFYSWYMALMDWTLFAFILSSIYTVILDSFLIVGVNKKTKPL